MKKIESFKQYSEFAKRTLRKKDSKIENDFHMYSGMLTELGEFLDPLKKYIAYGKEIDFTNLKEELGDHCWYIACKMVMDAENNQVSERLFDLTDRTILANLENSPTKEVPKWNSKSWRKEKRRKEKEECLTFLIGISKSLNYDSTDLSYILMVCKMFKFDFFEILTLNIEKLSKRYKEKFTEKEALSRNLEEERKALEK